MKKYFSQVHFFTFLTILLLVTSCNGQVKKDLSKENEHPKLKKNISDPQFGLVRCSLQDIEGNLWFGTTENGLYKYDGKSFNQFTVNDGVNCNRIYCILEDKDGKIWIGTEEGLCLYNGKTFDKIEMPLPKNVHPNIPEKYRNSNWIYSIIQAKDGKLWFATIDGTLVYDGKTFTPFVINKGGRGFLSSNHNVERILEDKAGNIWFGGRTNEGVYRFDGKSVTNIKIEELSLIQYDTNRVNFVWAWPQMQDKNGNIWFSNWDGAYRYDGKTFTSFSAKDGLTGKMVAKIIEDKMGNIWVSGDGLFRYDGKSFAPFTTKDGLTNLGGWSILEDTIGNLWVGTKEKGLYIFDGKEFITFSEYQQSPEKN